VSAHRRDPEDLGFFSGFIAGDGSFIIGANNAGGSWRCELGVTLRADNTPLLAAFRDWSGAGELFRAPARGGSSPQTAWTVARQSDCLKVAALLEARRPLGKADRQFQVWRRAVQIWAADGGSSPALAELSAELRSLHRSSAPAQCPVDITPAELAPFLAGFASAEAHFGTTERGSPWFTINLRADDAPLLALFQRVLQLGHLRDIEPAGRSQAAASWRIGQLEDLRRLVALFDAHPPRGRAVDVYASWRELVLLEPRPPARRRQLAAEVRNRRSFITGLDVIEPTSCAERSRRRCADALRRWAQSSVYPGSSTAYERWRRDTGRTEPSRNTVAAAYGSWAAALVAVGLDTSASLDPARVAAIRAGNEAGILARRVQSRARVIDAVRRCIRELGREPRAGEFLAWRRVHARDSPSQMTIYRLFPGGFDEVMAVAQGRQGAVVAELAGQLRV
jgi:hypothetical protein